MKASAQEDVLCFISVLNVAQQLKRGVAGMAQVSAALQRWAAGAADGALLPDVKSVRARPALPPRPSIRGADR